MLKSFLNNSKLLFSVLLAVCVLAGAGSVSYAIDQYPGDTSIYGVSTATIQPNVLIILDNSGSMSGTVNDGTSYNSGTIYAATNNCWSGSTQVSCASNTVYRSVSGKWNFYISNVDTGVSCATAKNSLKGASGLYNGKLKSTGVCTTPTGSFALGNYVNWYSVHGPRPKMDIAKEVLANLINSTDGVKFGLMIFNSNNPDNTANVEGGHIAGVGDGYGYSGYQAYVKDMDAIFSGTTTNRTALVNTVNNITPSTWTPLAETLFEAMRYYQGAATAFPSANASITYATPIEYSCQKNYIILITDGMSTHDNNAVLRTICSNGDCDGDGQDPGNPGSNGTDYLDDVAKYLYDTDLLTDGVDPKTTGKQNVITHTIGFGLTGADADAVALLTNAAYNGGGNYYLASSTSGLSESLRQILATIIEDNTSFVAPVVPVSPENRTFSGSRIYMGFFKPQTDGFWYGNLKKYGIDGTNAIVDKNGSAATNADGSIKDNAVSYWSSAADGGNVDQGGVGAQLLTRATARSIYTYTGTSTLLTDATNAFTTANAAITYTLLNVADATAKNNLVNYVHGYDAYDDDGNGITTEKRGWIMGDILHSKPLVVNYTSFTMAQETDCSVNKTMIYVGSNDGMLHAFRDCDGSELWAFIPQDLLPNLQYLHGTTHSYYVDSSPVAYTYDANNDGTIDGAAGDKTVLMFGERRGGGYYYAIDVSDPFSPRYLWRLSSTVSPSGTNTDYSELGESWSEPVMGKILTQVSGVDTTKIVAFIGAGYDNTAEDAQPTLTSTKGRGVYAVEIATLSGATPYFTNSGYKVWGYTTTQNSSLTRSIPSQLSVIDTDGNGYTDRVYAPDVGAYIWRFDVGDKLTSNWTGRRVFQSNPGADASTDRKMFYRPSVTLEIGYEMLYFGTGDREHPVDTSVVDRLYAVKDKGQTTAKSESNLTDATTAASVSITNTYGWYIKLNVNSGEKDLATASVINKTVYFTTYTPSGSTSSVCSADNRGTARFYAMSYLTAEAAYDYDTGNDVNGVVTKGATDRSKTIGTGIPSGMVTVMSANGVSAIVGTGGALVTPAISDRGSSVPTYWREVR
ncbi:MAG: hypothetical protein HZB84_00225 [Deltaproteobacteria bacterium]|nr:hypothetical protein [Deltaproteobacteria bacterium]